MNNFNDDLAWSHAQADDPMWESFYRAAFPAFDSMEYVNGDSPETLALQKQGVTDESASREAKWCWSMRRCAEENGMMSY